MRVLLPILVSGLLGLTAYTIWITVAWRIAVKRLRGMDDWRAWLPKSERIKYAREMLDDALEQQELIQQERLTQIIANPFTNTRGNHEQ